MVLRLRRAGLTYTEICDLTGLKAVSNVHYYVKNLGK